MDGLFCNNNVASGELNTALGCIPVNDIQEFLKVILPFGVGIAGGIAVILIITSTFQIMSSSGNPEKVKSAKELLYAALSGLMLLIFSIFVYRLIGVDILQLPGL